MEDRLPLGENAMTSLVTATPVSVGHEAGSREALLYWQRDSVSRLLRPAVAVTGDRMSHAVQAPR